MGESVVLLLEWAISGTLGGLRNALSSTSKMSLGSPFNQPTKDKERILERL